jgi:tRNA A-37 threonylcarbamoyl transferase component Bud32
VHEWREGEVLKLFAAGSRRVVVEYERLAAQTAERSGLPVPHTGDIFEIDGRLGIAYERIAGPMLRASLFASPESAAEAGKITAKLQKKIHAMPGAQLPSGPIMHAQLIQVTHDLTSEEKVSVISRLQKMPAGDRLCHGDFHANNIPMSGHGPIAIDWGAAHSGNPIEDAAQTWVAITKWLASGSDRRRDAMVHSFIASYERTYFAGNEGALEEFEAWKPIVAAIRLSLGHPQSSEAPLRELMGNTFS